MIWRGSFPSSRVHQCSSVAWRRAGSFLNCFGQSSATPLRMMRGILRQLTLPIFRLQSIARASKCVD